jgi:hypothetical protein
MSFPEFYQGFCSTVWLLWVITWFVFARNVKATVRREAVLPRMLNMALLFGAGALLWAQRIPGPGLMERFLPGSQWQFWASRAFAKSYAACRSRPHGPSASWLEYLL